MLAIFHSNNLQDKRHSLQPRLGQHLYNYCTVSIFPWKATKMLQSESWWELKFLSWHIKSFSAKFHHVLKTSKFHIIPGEHFTFRLQVCLLSLELPKVNGRASSYQAPLVFALFSGSQVRNRNKIHLFVAVLSFKWVVTVIQLVEIQKLPQQLKSKKETDM